MANPDHVRMLLEEGVEVWNQWREDNPEVVPNLEDADLRGATYQVIDFREARLRGANLQGVDLTLAQLQGAKLQGAELQEVDLTLANLQGADLWGALLQDANLTLAQLEQTIFFEADLQGVELQNANFCGADIQWANLSKVRCKGIKYDNKMKCRGVTIEDSVGGKRFVSHVRDLDYLEEFKEAHLWWHFGWKITCNCGRSIWPWAAWSIGFALAFGAIFAKYEVWSWLPDWTKEILVAIDPIMKHHSGTEMVNGFTPYYFSIVTFTTLGFGDVTPLNLAGQIWLTLEVTLGYVMLGGLITLFATKLVRQSG